VVPNAVPPVCQITEYGKFLYDEKKKAEAQQTSQAKVKEIYLTPRIDSHDLQTKANHSMDFLRHHDSVKVILEFSGREMQHKEIGFEVMQKFLAATAESGKPLGQPKLAGRKITVMLHPVKRPDAAPDQKTV